MFGIGSTEFLVILLVALLVLGPRNLAKASRTIGKYVGEFRRISTDFQRTLNAEVAQEEKDEQREAVRRKVEEAKAARAKKLASQGKKAASGPAETAAADTGTAAATSPFQAAADREEDMVQPPKGSPIEAMLAKTAAEAGTTVTTTASTTATTAGQSARDNGGQA